MLSLGIYPDVPLSEARERREIARKTLATGTDPSADRKEMKATQKNTFQAVAEHWLAGLARHVRDKRRAESTYRKAKWLLESFIFPDLGARPIGSITAPELLTVLKKIEGDDGYTGREATRLALKLAPLVFLRPGELRRAEWAHVDFEAAEWRIPPRIMKLPDQHIVPLSRQALDILRSLHALTGHGRFVFPCLGNPDRPMSENTLNKALRTLGYGGDEMTAHGFRSIASTLLNEQHRWTGDAIERQLAHWERDSTRAAYNYAEYLPERREMMQAWAAYLDGLRAGRKAAPGQQSRSPAVNLNTSEQEAA